MEKPDSHSGKSVGSAIDHPVCSGARIAPYTEPNVTEHDVMDVYGSTSLTAWTVVSTEQGKSAAKVNRPDQGRQDVYAIPRHGLRPALSLR